MSRQKKAAGKLIPGPDGMKSRRLPAEELSRPVREMVEGLHAVCDAVEAGVPLEKVATVRTCTIDVRLPELSAAQIRSIRNSLGLSQALFATFLGVGMPTVRSWEQGHRAPSAMARRFLGVIRDDPDYWKEKLAGTLSPRQNGVGS